MATTSTRLDDLRGVRAVPNSPEALRVAPRELVKLASPKFRHGRRNGSFAVARGAAGDAGM